jgi:excisionase family DNA binding protein
MDENPTLETVLRNLLIPIINEAVDKAIARHYLVTPSPLTDQNEILDVKKTAEILFLSVPTIYGLVHKHSIPYYKRGKRLYFRKDDLLKWIAGSWRMINDEIRQQADQYILKNGKK